MDDLKRMTDAELANRIVNYVDRIQKLMDAVSAVMDGKGNSIMIDEIHSEYKAVKQEIKDDAHYLDLNINKRTDKGAALYNGFFEPGISEAAAWGFTASTNSRINFKFFDSLEEARYKLTKYHSLNEWKATPPHHQSFWNKNIFDFVFLSLDFLNPLA